MRFEEFSDCLAWWDEREKNDHAWKVSARDVLIYDEEGNLVSANLDIKNPNSTEAIEHLPPVQLVADIIDKERQILTLMGEIEQALKVEISQ
jgi:type I restriction enzyme M protein